MHRMRTLIAIAVGAILTLVIVPPQALTRAVDVAIHSTPLTAQPAAEAAPDDGAAPADEVPQAPDLPPAQAARYVHWTERGVRFEDEWQPERLAVVLSVLDHFEDSIGEARFLQLIEQGVAWHSNGEANGLIFSTAPDTADLTAWWRPEEGRIVLSDKLFDPAHVDTHHRWRFLPDLAEAKPQPVTVPEFTVAHELGHLIADALRAEHIARQLAPTYLEDIYAERLFKDFWANPLQPAVNESLASEIALWVYTIRRPFQVLDYDQEVLVPALMGASVPSALNSTN